MNTKLLTIAGVLVTFLGPNLATARRVKECGVELYYKRRDPMCGVTYKEVASEYCDVKRHKSKASMICPGSVKAHWKRFSIGYGNRHFATNIGGPKYYGTNNLEKLQKMGVSKGQYGMYGGGEFLIPDQPATCEHKSFGPAEYNTCRAVQHGPEEIKSCRNEKFGEELFYDCEIIKTKTEMEIYISSIETNIDTFFFSSLLLTKGGLLTETVQITSRLACLIEENGGSNSETELVKNIIEQFEYITGVEYDESLASNCDNALTSAEKVKANCEENKRGRLCRLQKALETQKDFLVKKSKANGELINDVVAKKDSLIREKLINIDQLINIQLELLKSILSE